MNDKPMISTIIPVFNGERYVGEAISSILSQDYRPLEVIVVDDGSTDGTAEVVNRFGAGVRYYYQNNSGTAVSRNRGTAYARGPFYAFLDADDLWPPDKLTVQMAAFEADPALEAVFGLVRQFYTPDLARSVRKRVRCLSGTVPGYCAPAMLIKREAFHRVGPFSEKWRVGQFEDWYSRAMDKGLRFQLVLHVVLKRRIHDANMGITHRDCRTDYCRLLKAALDRRRNHAEEAERAATDSPDGSS